MCEEITEQMEEAFKSLNPEEKKKMIRRLYLKWHPDKNMNNIDIATEVTKHIQNEVDRLEKGLPRKNSAGNFTRQEDFSDFWDSRFRSWDDMAQNQGRQRKRYYNNYRRRAKEDADFSFNTSSGSGNKQSWNVPPSFQTNDILAARSWLDQSMEDLEASKKVLVQDVPDYEWAAFIGRMAMERSVKS